MDTDNIEILQESNENKEDINGNKNDLVSDDINHDKYKNREYLKDNFITDHIIGNTHTECIRNLFKLHQEGVNAWTMIFSNLSVILIIIYIFMKDTKHHSKIKEH